jgi:hypothetical protein
MWRGYYEEGDKCPKCKEGKFKYETVDPDGSGCYCHICPPCGVCTSSELTCDSCAHVPEEPEYTYKAVGGSISEQIFKPKPLDNTKVDWRYTPHTYFSMIKKGVYPKEMSREEVEAQVKGTFGGRFVSFGGGNFEYIAYTD